MPWFRLALMSRVPVYLTWTPVWFTQGWIMARNEVCSSPDQVPMTVIVPPMGPVVGVTVAVTPGAGVVTGPVVAGGAAVGVELVLVHAVATTAVATSNARGRHSLVGMALPGNTIE